MMERVYKTVTRRIELADFKDKIKLWLFGDIHRFTKSCDEERWKWFLQSAKKIHDQNTYYLGLGDYTDFASTREQKAIKQELHIQTIIDFDAIVQKRNRLLAREMSFMKGNLLGLIDGNHGWTFQNGTTGTEDLANRLGTEFLGWLCHFTLKIKMPPLNINGKITTVYIVACHGRAGGKTAGISINQVDDMKTIFPIADIYCVSDDTEILTTNGWMSRKEISKDDIVYCLDNETQELELSKIRNKVEYFYDGEMISIKNKNTDQLLLPEHRIYYKYRGQKEKYLINTADHISKLTTQIELPLAGNFNMIISGMLNEEIALTGWIIAEGHFKGNGSDWGSGILIYQKDPIKVALIRGLLDHLYYKYSERLRSDGITVFYIKKESAELIKEYVSKKDRLPEWIYGCNESQFDLFWDAFIKGDGHRLNEMSGTAYSCDLGLMDDIQRALVLHGYRSNLSYKKGGFKNGGYIISWCKKKTTEFSVPKTITRQQYSGIVWCIETKYNTFIARRNGKVFITGNCMGHDHQRLARPVSVLVPMYDNDGETYIKQKRQFLCRSGSFKKAYVPDTTGYEVGRLLRPADLGALRLDISFHRDCSEGDRVITDIQAII